MANWTLSTAYGDQSHELNIEQNADLVFKESRIERGDQFTTVIVSYARGIPPTPRISIDTGIPHAEEHYFQVDILVDGVLVHQEKIRAEGSGT